jgi:hypothetical protein
MKIDAVITWVDGDDPRHRAKREKYGNITIANRDDVAGATRYSSLGEIFYCVASLNRFAPWLNKIYIVTDEQNPQLDAFIAEHFPERHIPMEIVDHKVIFRDYEQYLPTFNSISIESMTWRIPGLSEYYIEFNDDLILAAPTTPEDFFLEDGTVVCYGKRYSALQVALSNLFRRNSDGSKQVSFRQTMLNGAKLLGKRRDMIKVYHTPKALRRSVYEEYFMAHPDHLVNNICHRFRHHAQYNVEVIQYLLLLDRRRCCLKEAYDNLLYLKPKKDDDYIAQKLAKFSSLSGHKFGCFNSLDQMSDEGRSMTIRWIEQRIGLK